jgi:hypothetical protein
MTYLPADRDGAVEIKDALRREQLDVRSSATKKNPVNLLRACLSDYGNSAAVDCGAPPTLFASTAT